MRKLTCNTNQRVLVGAMAILIVVMMVVVVLTIIPRKALKAETSPIVQQTVVAQVAESSPVVEEPKVEEPKVASSEHFSRDNIPISRSRITTNQRMRVLATGYCDDGITATGVPTLRGKVSTVAVDPDVIPYGSIMFVPGYGWAVAADCGDPDYMSGKRLDLYFNTEHDVYSQWGKKEVIVEIYHIGNGKLTKKELEELNKE